MRCKNCSPEHLARHLGEQAEVEVVTRKIESGLFIPLYAIAKYNGREGTVWTVEDGKLHRRVVKFGERLLDGRVVVADKMPDNVRIVINRDATRLREGRAARMAERAP